MQFELFERKSRPTSTVPTIGLQTRGTMSLNAAAFELLSSTAKHLVDSDQQHARRLGKQTAKTDTGADALVEFLYDKKEKIVGVRLASPTSKNSYPVRRQPQSESYLVTAKAFIAYYGIPLDKLRRYAVRLHNDEMLVFSLTADEVS